jgi:8-oxo-dGTP pyrophosphatase MutT (NUDIX family)
MGDNMNRIRPLAICVFRNEDRILVNEGYDPVKQEAFYRPLGGGIEFGESSMDTVCRELMEELNVDVDRESLRKRMARRSAPCGRKSQTSVRASPSCIQQVCWKCYNKLKLISKGVVLCVGMS